jgi:type III secretion protein J
MVKHRSGVDMSNQVGQIKAIVVNSVEGLTYDGVTVSLFPARDAGQNARPAAASGSSGALLPGYMLPAMGAALVVVVLLLGMLVARERRLRARAEGR